MPSNFDLTGVYQEELGEALDRIRTLEAQRDILQARCHELAEYGQERIDALTAQRDELLAALEDAESWISQASKGGHAVHVHVLQVIARTKGGDNGR